MKNLILILLLIFTAGCSSNTDISLSDVEIFNTWPLTAYQAGSMDTYDNEFLLNGEVNGDQDFDEVGFFLSDKPYSSETDGMKFIAADLSDGKFSCWATDLTPGVTYLVRPYGIGQDGIHLGKTIQVASNPEIKDIVFVSGSLSPADAKSGVVFMNFDQTDGATADMVKEYGIKYWLPQTAGDESTYFEKRILANSEEYTYDPMLGLGVEISDLKLNEVYQSLFYVRTRQTNGAYQDFEYEIDLPDIENPTSHSPKLC